MNANDERLLSLSGYFRYGTESGKFLTCLAFSPPARRFHGRLAAAILTLSTAEGLTMKDAIGYQRVGTREQGRSGLGLAAQRHDIEAFGARDGFSVKTWYQDIQTGAGKDALLRPGLAEAPKGARASRCPLIVSRLDRLSRNVHFITGLMPPSSSRNGR